MLLITLLFLPESHSFLHWFHLSIDSGQQGLVYGNMRKEILKLYLINWNLLWLLLVFV
uniref:Uncharacterized protein n=2 Tax=Anguilla anguilla TaxID=7936 RepID=A0A0E9UGE7_ANGAN